MESAIFEKMVKQLSRSFNLEYQLNNDLANYDPIFKRGLCKAVLDEICYKLGEEGRLDPWDIKDEDLKSVFFLQDVKNGNILKTEIWKLDFDINLEEHESLKEKISQIKKALAYLEYTLQQQNIERKYFKVEYNPREGIISEPHTKAKIDYLEYKLKTLIIENDKDSESNTELENFTSNVPINLDQKERFVYWEELQLIEFLKNKIKERGLPYSDKRLYTLLNLCAGISEASAKQLMSFVNYKENISRNNPFIDKEIMERVNKNLINNSMK